MSQQDTNYPFIQVHMQQEQEEHTMLGKEILHHVSMTDRQETIKQLDGHLMSDMTSLQESIQKHWSQSIPKGKRGLLFVIVILGLISQSGIFDKEQLIQLGRYLILL